MERFLDQYQAPVVARFQGQLGSDTMLSLQYLRLKGSPSRSPRWKRRNQPGWDETSELVFLFTRLPRSGDRDEPPQLALPYTGCPGGLRHNCIRMHQYTQNGRSKIVG